MARPATIATASRSIAGAMLSSSTASMPMASASSSWASVSTSTSILTRWPTPARARSNRRADAAGHRDVVVLDEHRVVEAEAVVAAATDPHRVFFDRPQPRRRFPRVDDGRHGVRDRGDDGGGDRGDAGEMAEEVERGALGAQQRARRPLDATNHIARAKWRCRRACRRCNVAAGSISAKASRASVDAGDRRRAGGRGSSLSRGPRPARSHPW